MTAVAPREPELEHAADLPNPMRVVQLFEPSTGGIAAHVELLTHGLIARGRQVTVVGPEGTDVMSRFRAAGVDVVSLRLAHLPHPSDVAAIRALTRMIRARPALVHAHGTKAGLLAGRVARATGAPTIYTPHAWVIEQGRTATSRTFYARVERWSARPHRRIVAVSENDLRLGISYRVASGSRIRLVTNGIPAAAAAVDRASAREALGLDADRFVACWIGRNAPQKRPQDLPPLARSLAERGITLAALGVGLTGTTIARAVEAAGGVVFAAQVSPSLVYAASDVLVSTSAWEGHPLTVLEALRGGLPVVAYSVGGIPEQVDDGENGHLVRLGSVDRLADRVAALAADEPARLAMGAAAKASFDRRFRLERMLDGIEAVYAEAAAEQG